MKKIFYSLFLATAGICFVASCDEDRDSNPSINQNVTTFTLNTPANAVNVYDLENSKSVVLTTAQPDYGIPVAVTYQPSVSLDGTDFKVLPTTYTTTTIAIDAKELNSAVLDMAGSADLSQPISLTFKLSASVTGMPTIESNTVELPKVLAYVPKVEVTLPTKFFIVGSYPGSGWSTFTPMHQAYSVDGMFYGIVPMEQGSNFKLSPKDGWGEDLGFGSNLVAKDGELAEGLTSSDDGNFVFNGATGLYTVIVKAKIANGAVAYTLSFSPAKIYLFGACGLAADNWGWADENLFTDNGDGTATSPALGDAGELRMAVDCGTDWWKTEFTIMNTDATLFYRNVDMPSNWAENVGADYSFQGVAGKTIKLDFTTGTGKME